jgi:hypothetical protein
MEITNKTLAMFLVAAIVVSLAGTIISLNKLGSISTTGYASNVNATARVNVNAVSSVVFRISSMDWGTGSVTANASATQFNCTLISNATNSVDCFGFNVVTNPFVLENDGNTNVSVTLKSNATATQFIGGTAVYGGPVFQYNVSNNETSSCVTPAPAGFTDVNVTGAGTQICDVLDSTDTKDTIKIHIKINIPYTATTGDRTANLMATATGL